MSYFFLYLLRCFLYSFKCKILTLMLNIQLINLTNTKVHELVGELCRGSVVATNQLNKMVQTRINDSITHHQVAGTNLPSDEVSNEVQLLEYVMENVKDELWQTRLRAGKLTAFKLLFTK